MAPRDGAKCLIFVLSSLFVFFVHIYSAKFLDNNADI